MSGCCYLSEEANPDLATTSFQAAAESNVASPEPPFLQAKHPLLPQPLFIGFVLQTLHQHHAPLHAPLLLIPELVIFHIRAPRKAR